MEATQSPAPPLPWVNVTILNVDGYGPAVLNLHATLTALNVNLVGIQQFMNATQTYLVWLTKEHARTEEERRILLAVEAAGIKEHILAYFALSDGERADLGLAP